MILTIVCRAAVSPTLKIALKHPTVIRLPTVIQKSVIRTFADEGKTISRLERIAKRRALREGTDAADAAFSIGKGAVAGGAAIGLGALCLYGLGLSKEPGAIDRAIVWPEYVKQRIRSTYLYFGGSIILTAATAAMLFRSPAAMNMLTRNSLTSLFLTMGAMVGSGMIVQNIPYQPGLGAKQLAWMVHTGIIGAVIAPLCFLGGPIMIRAACYTAGVIGGLSAIAVCAPSEKFLSIGGPLAIGFGVVLASSIGTWFLPPTTALGASLYSISLYGGLLLFSGFLLYDTQRIIKKAETYPVGAARPYDPVNASLSIYMDTINIFVRIATILAGGGNRRK